MTILISNDIERIVLNFLVGFAKFMHNSMISLY